METLPCQHFIITLFSYCIYTIYQFFLYINASLCPFLNIWGAQYVNVLICQGLYSTYISMAHNVNVFINQERNTYVLYIIVYCIVYYTIHYFKGSKKQLINQYIYPGLDMSINQYIYPGFDLSIHISRAWYVNQSIHISRAWCVNVLRKFADTGFQMGKFWNSPQACHSRLHESIYSTLLLITN